MSRFWKILGALLFVTHNIFAQTPDKVKMADVMRSNGKIYVVVATIVIIFIGFFIYLIQVDRKVNRLEKELLG